MFGWSYPPGCSNVPGDEEDEQDEDEQSSQEHADSQKRGCVGCGSKCSVPGCRVCENGELCMRCIKEKEARRETTQQFLKRKQEERKAYA